MPICSICKKNKYNKSFYKRETGKLRTECKDCVIARTKKYDKTHPQKYNGRSARWRNTGYGNWKTYYSRAKIKGMKFQLGPGYFEQLKNKTCYYCGRKSFEDGIRMGVDRMDSKEGYTMMNSVPCCWFCNRIKSDKTADEFINQCKRIVSYQKQKEEQNGSK